MPCGTSCGAWPGPRTNKSRASFSSFRLLKEGAGFRKCPPRLERGSLFWKTGRCRSVRLRCRPCPSSCGKGFSLQEARGAGKTLRRGTFHGDAATGKGGLARLVAGSALRRRRILAPRGALSQLLLDRSGVGTAPCPAWRPSSPDSGLSPIRLFPYPCPACLSADGPCRRRA